MLKTHTCGELRKESVGSRVTLAGWVDRRRDHGGLIFIDIRDREGVTQVVFNPEIAKACHDIAAEMRSEYAIQVTGEVSPRPAGTENPKLPTGDIEIIARETRILNTSRTPPFYINEEIEVDENVRLKYRYLDLRRQRLKNNILLRHRVMKYMRDFLDVRGFTEVETPILLKSTPEGARDYLVPSRLHPGKFYALPQSPQQLKQLLMVGGIEKYYQIARCFRDEDSRADRQPEFTQLDIEMSFVEEEDILRLIEDMYIGLVSTLKPEKKMKTPFPRLTYAETMSRFGTDKPDLRYGMEIHDISSLMTNSAFGIFRSAVAAGGSVKGICALGCASYTRSQLEDLNQLGKSLGAGGVVTISLDASAGSLGNLTMDKVKSAAAKFLSIDDVKNISKDLEAKAGDLLLLVAGDTKLVNMVLGELRREMGRRLKLADPEEMAFAFIVDFPLLERDPKSGNWHSVHHPFTSPKPEDMALLDTAPEKVRGSCYDFVCNGYELSSGSIRIHTTELQRRIFKMLGYTDQQVEERFGHMLEAFSYGAPPHGGIAPGVDRTIMLLANEENIREVVAFPKNQAAADLTFNAPDVVTEEQLSELHIKLREE